jgi:hypothetical protein
VPGLRAQGIIRPDEAATGLKAPAENWQTATPSEQVNKNHTTGVEQPIISVNPAGWCQSLPDEWPIPVEDGSRIDPLEPV